MIPRTITNRWLQSKGECADQRKLFREVFPEGMPVTLPNLRKAAKRGLELGWLAGHLSPSARAEYDAKRAPMLAEYDAKHAPIWAEYNAKHAPIWAEYSAKRAPILAEYDAKRAPIWAEYSAKHAPIRAEYDAKRDTILLAAIRADWKAAK